MYGRKGSTLFTIIGGFRRKSQHKMLRPRQTRRPSGFFF
jgi:hypothetical protein